MRVVVFGATGNVGLAVVRALRATPDVSEIVGVARRAPSGRRDVRWATADIVSDDLAPLVDGADAVVHLAWAIQPSRDLRRMRAVNIDGTARLLDAVERAGVPVLLYASSVGAYSPRQSSEPVDESWPTHGVATSSYGRQKAYAERMLDDFECRHAGVRVVRMRPGLIFQAAAAAAQRRYFAGPLLPRALLRPGVLPLLPHLYLRFQAVHADDVAAAFVAALRRDVSGAFNLAADPVLSTADIAELLQTRTAPVPIAVARAALAAGWHARLHPLEPGWLDLAAQIPTMDITRATGELGWTPAHSGRDALHEVLRGIAAGTGGPTPTLQPMNAARAVVDAARSGMGRRMSADPAAQIPRPGETASSPHQSDAAPPSRSSGTE